MFLSSSFIVFSNRQSSSSNEVCQSYLLVHHASFAHLSTQLIITSSKCKLSILYLKKELLFKQFHLVTQKKILSTSTTKQTVVRNSALIAENIAGNVEKSRWASKYLKTMTHVKIAYDLLLTTLITFRCLKYLRLHRQKKQPIVEEI